MAREAAALGLAVVKPADMRATEVHERLAARRAPTCSRSWRSARSYRRHCSRCRAPGCLNLHGSLLPGLPRRLAGAARAVGRPRRGPACARSSWTTASTPATSCCRRAEPVREDDDAASLAARLAELGGPLLAESCVLAHEGRAPRTPQDRTAGSYAKKLKKADGAVDWTLPARTVWHHARAVTPWPGATAGHAGRRFIVLASHPGTRAVARRAKCWPWTRTVSWWRAVRMPCA